MLELGNFQHVCRSRRASPLFPTARPPLDVRHSHHENALWLIAVHDEVRKPCQTHALRAVQMSGPASRGLGDPIQRGFELRHERPCHTRIPLGVPCGGLLGFGEGGWL